MVHSLPTRSRAARWPDYRAIWRWHFYAGLFCIPFIVWLSITGSIYLFRPQIEALIDKPYDTLAFDGPSASAADQVMAALRAQPGYSLHFYELPRTPHSAARVIVGRGSDEIRVYVHPQNLRILKMVHEDQRLMRVIFKLHGELLMGDWGSRIVELAASWTIVMIVTGLCLWWPRGAARLGGILFPRLGAGSRIFWRDLHAVTGLWVSFFALFLLITGLPWTSGWGGYLKEMRHLAGAASIRQDWTTGSQSEASQRAAMNATSLPGMSMEHMEHRGGDMGAMIHGEAAPLPAAAFVPIDRLVRTLLPLDLAPPVLISPPMKGSPNWTAKSDAQNRPRRVDLVLDGTTGQILSRQDFDQRPLIDRLVGIGVAAHEGQLFGWFNQLLGLFTASSLVMLAFSAVLMWWRRKPVGVLGAPVPLSCARSSAALMVVLVSLGILLPLFGISVLLVLALERAVLRRFPALALWLGIRTKAA